MAVVIPQQTIQQDAQAAMPVIPNNGNPAGAYNMPQQPAPAKTPGQLLTEQITGANSPYRQYIQNQLQLLSAGPTPQTAALTPQLQAQATPGVILPQRG